MWSVVDWPRWVSAWARIPDVTIPEVEGQGVERGGLAQTGEWLGAGIGHHITPEIEGQGVERGGFAQTGECLGAGFPDRSFTPEILLIREVVGQGVERGGLAQMGQSCGAGGPDPRAP